MGGGSEEPVKGDIACVKLERHHIATSESSMFDPFRFYHCTLHFA